MRNTSEAMKQHVKQFGIICFAIMSGVIIFSGVVWYLVNQGGFTPSEGLPAYLATVLNLVALVVVLVVHYSSLGLCPPPPEVHRRKPYLAWHRRNTILGFALREGGAFIALVGVLLTGEQVGGFAMAGLALLSMVLAWPRAVGPRELRAHRLEARSSLRPPPCSSSQHRSRCSHRVRRFPRAIRRQNPAVQDGVGEEELPGLVHPVHDVPVHPILLLLRDALRGRSEGRPC